MDGTLDQPGTVMQTRSWPARGQCVHGVDSEWSGVCAWFCVSWNVRPISDRSCAVQCQHATLGNDRSSIRGAPTVFKSVWPLVDGTLDQPGMAMQTRPWPARGQCVHGVDSEWRGVCAWFCVSWNVRPISDRFCAVQCQHATLRNARGSKRGAPTVFKSVWPLVDGTLDQPGLAM